MANSYERALWAVEDAKRELAEAEASGDHEAVLIWQRSVEEAEDEAAYAFGGSFTEPYEDEGWYR